MARGERVERWLSLAVSLAALCAVAVSLYQASLAREQLRASAWPYVMQSNSYAEGQPYTRQVENAGVGPARVQSFEVLVDGKPQRSWGSAVQMMTQRSDSGAAYSSLGRGSVLAPGVTLTVLRLPAGPQARMFWEAAQTRLETRLCYCSIYDECWEADTRKPEPVGTSQCGPVSGATPER